MEACQETCGGNKTYYLKSKKNKGQKQRIKSKHNSDGVYKYPK